MKTFMRDFLKNSLKDNPNITRSYITGVSRLSKANIFSGLNNLTEYGLDTNTFKSSFGFTSEEVRSLLDVYYKINYPEPENSDTTAFKEKIKLKKEESFLELQRWYNAYLISGVNLFNPFSV